MQYANKEKELLLQIERDVDALYTLTADSLSSAVYYEFASNNILHFWNSLARYNEEKIQTITPYNLRNTASLYYAQKLSDCNKQLWSIAESLPLYVKSNLSIEEIVFYNSLIEKRLPYEQYKK
jgi:site-specific DNA-adenine methylase